MSKKPSNIKPICATNLKKLMIEEGLTQTKFSEKIHVSQQTTSKILNLKSSLTESLATHITEIFPKYSVEWLLGYSDNMYKTDYVKEFLHQRGLVNDALKVLVDYAWKEVCAREHDKEDRQLDSIPDIETIHKLIKDYAIGLMWHYYHSSQSAFWDTLKIEDDKD